MNDHTPLLLIVDDDLPRSAAHARALTAAGHTVLQEHDSLSGLFTVEERRPDVVVLHWSLPFLDGAIFRAVLRAGLPKPPLSLVLASADVSPSSVREAGADLCLPADVFPDRLVTAVRQLLHD